MNQTKGDSDSDSEGTRFEFSARNQLSYSCSDAYCFLQFRQEKARTVPSKKTQLTFFFILFIISFHNYFILHYTISAVGTSFLDDNL
jgi:hypothetical protein